MHRHQIVAQILLILSILNSALAAPVVLSVQEMPGKRSFVAVRVPTEGVVAVLEKRPFDPEWETPAKPSPGSSEIQPSSEPSSEISEIKSSPENSEFQTTTSPEHAESQVSLPTSPPKKISTRPKIMTPGNIKSAKIYAGAALISAVILSLVDINISFQNRSSSS
jgi:hypothetical protein